MGNVLSCFRPKKFTGIDEIPEAMSSETSEALTSEEIQKPFSGPGAVYTANPDNQSIEEEEEAHVTSPKVSPRRLSSDEEEMLKNLPTATRRASQLPPLSQMSPTAADNASGITPFAPFGARRSSIEYDHGLSSPPTKPHNAPLVPLHFGLPAPTDADEDEPTVSQNAPRPPVQVFDFSKAAKGQYAQDLFSSFGQERAPTGHAADLPIPRARAHTLGPVTGLVGGATPSAVPISHKPRSQTIGPNSGLTGHVFGTSPRPTSQAPVSGSADPPSAFGSQLSPRGPAAKQPEQIFRSSPTPSGGQQSLSPTDPIRDVFAPTPTPQSHSTSPSTVAKNTLPFESNVYPTMTKPPALPPSRYMGPTGNQTQMFSSLPPVKQADIGGPQTLSKLPEKLPDPSPKRTTEPHDNPFNDTEEYDFPDFN